MLLRGSEVTEQHIFIFTIVVLHWEPVGREFVFQAQSAQNT